MNLTRLGSSRQLTSLLGQLCKSKLCHTTHNNFSTSVARHTGGSSGSAAYQGDGRTTVRVLNQEESQLNLINTYSANGFRLNNNLFINGAIILFPTQLFSWNVEHGIDVTEESLLIFDLIVPKVKIVIIGYGQYGEPHDASIPLKLKRKGISCEMLATPNAVTTYNYLVHDSVHVAGAFVPMKHEVKMDRRDGYAIKSVGSIESGDYVGQPGLRGEPAAHREKLGVLKGIAQKTALVEKDKKKFDE